MTKRMEPGMTDGKGDSCRDGTVEGLWILWRHGNAALSPNSSRDRIVEHPTILSRQNQAHLREPGAIPVLMLSLGDFLISFHFCDW